MADQSNEPANKRARIPRAKTIAFTLLAVVLFFAAAEGLLRLLKYSSDDFSVWMRFNNPHRNDSFMKRDPVLFWRFREDPSAGMGINGQGLRGPEIPVEKPEGVFRILCIGDSSTFGCNVKQDQTYTRQLEIILGRRCPEANVQTINAGVPGYSSYQGMKALETWLLPYEPDLVVTYFGIHDLAEAVLIQDKDQREIARGGIWLDRALESSVLYQMLAKLVRESKGIRPGEIGQDSVRIARVEQEDYFGNHMLMRQTAESIGGRLLVVPAVAISDKGDCGLVAYDPQRLQAEYDSLDLCPVLEATGRAASFFDPGGVHPTPEGHRIYAWALADWIISRGIIQCSEPESAAEPTDAN